MRKILITGMPGSGKSRLIKEFLKFYSGSVAGILTEEIREKGKRIGFKIRDIATEKEKILAHIDFEGPQVSKYHVDVDSLEEIAIPALSKEADLYVIDEIGKMELFSEKFEEKVKELLTSNKDVLATLHKDYVDNYKNFGEVIILEKKYWGKVFKKILEAFSDRTHV